MSYSLSHFVTVFGVCKVSLQSFDITPPKSFLSIIIIIIIIMARPEQEIKTFLLALTTALFGAM